MENFLLQFWTIVNVGRNSASAIPAWLSQE